MKDQGTVNKRWAIVTFRTPGYHHYPEAPEEVAYLRQEHRHMFHITIWIEQFGNNRDLEYHMVKTRAYKWWIAIEPTGNYGAKSCEMLAEELRESLMKEYPKRMVKVAVFEDGENGGFIE